MLNIWMTLDGSDTSVEPETRIGQFVKHKVLACGALPLIHESRPIETLPYIPSFQLEVISA
jgi:hypothetical protein